METKRTHQIEIYVNCRGQRMVILELLYNIFITIYEITTHMIDTVSYKTFKDDEMIIEIDDRYRKEKLTITIGFTLWSSYTIYIKFIYENIKALKHYIIQNVIKEIKSIARKYKAIIYTRSIITETKTSKFNMISFDKSSKNSSNL